MGVYGADGGYVVFLGGNVSFYKNAGSTGQAGIFTYHSGHPQVGQRSNNIMHAFGTPEASFSSPAATFE